MRLSWIVACACIAVPSVAAASTGDAKYYGGHVISHVQVVPVFWGQGVSADVVKGAQGFYAAIVDSPYMDWLGEYDTVGLNGVTDAKPGSNQRIYRGSVLPAVTITPKNTSKSIADADVQAELLAQLAAGKLPAPRVGADGGVDTVYMIAFPSSVKVSDFGGQDVCSGACAYHWTVTAPGVSAGVPYAVIPDCGTGQQNYCSLGSGVFDTYTGDAAHELIEAITDPECGLDTSQDAARPIGWFDPSKANGEGEVADICLDDPSSFTKYQGFMVQAIWSQRLGKCITNDPTLKLCDGKTRPCTPCKASDCSGDTPVCDDATGACVASGGSSSGGSSSGGSSSGGSSSGGSSSGGDGDTPGGNGGPTGGSSGQTSAGTSSGGTKTSAGCAVAPSRAPWELGLGVFAVLARRRRRRA